MENTNKIFLSRKSAMELIELKQDLGFISKDIPKKEIERLVNIMIKIPLGTLF